MDLESVRMLQVLSEEIASLFKQDLLFAERNYYQVQQDDSMIKEIGFDRVVFQVN